ADRVDLVVRERERIGDRHGAAHVIEERRRVRPIAAHRAHRRLGRERADATGQRIGRLAGAFRAVAGEALLLVDLQAIARGAASRWKSGAARRDADVEARELLCGDWLAEFWRRRAGTLRRGARGER